jgi:hypothetical protein
MVFAVVDCFTLDLINSDWFDGPSASLYITKLHMVQYTGYCYGLVPCNYNHFSDLLCSPSEFYSFLIHSSEFSALVAADTPSVEKLGEKWPMNFAYQYLPYLKGS